ncbi:hypothetical protein R1sor_004609 [Riccia sorocarpa]|uniref:Reverse transcriptase domain-containing protein n=1 Tax=Riccia sorocarpa TaxID=122646 RepID=A0ABD3HHS8_9MARC
MLRSCVGGLPVISAFADDTSFFTSTDPDSFIALFQLLELFGSVSGCRVNWDKTKHICLGKYKAPPDWLLNYQFISLAKTQGTRYLGAFLANKARPSDVWEFVSRKLAKRLQGFSAKIFKFEAKVVIVCFLLQAMLSFSIALTRFRLADLHKFERLFAVYLWGSTADGKAKTALAAWVYVAKPLTLGGLGIWNLRLFQKALVIKLILNSIEDMDLLWSDLMWNSLHRLLPSLEPLRFLLQLLCKAGSITVDRLSELLTLLEDFLDTPAYVLHADSCLDRIPELVDWAFTADFWNFHQDEWVLHSPISASAEGFPLTVKGGPLVSGTSQARWSLHMENYLQEFLYGSVCLLNGSIGGNMLVL